MWGIEYFKSACHYSHFLLIPQLKWLNHKQIIIDIKSHKNWFILRRRKYKLYCYCLKKYVLETRDAEIKRKSWILFYWWCFLCWMMLKKKNTMYNISGSINWIVKFNNFALNPTFEYNVIIQSELFLTVVVIFRLCFEWISF